MHPMPRRPARGNWIWLAASAVSVTVLTGAAFHYASAGVCRPRAAHGPPRPHPTSPATGLTAGRSPVPATWADAAPRPSGRATAGMALFYDPGAAAGSCSLGPFPAGGFYVSLPPGQYAGGAACGSYLDVHGPDGSVRAEVVDLCPGCAATTINLSRAAFDRIGNPGPGYAEVTYQRAADPRLPGPLEIRVSATPGMLAVQILRHGNPLSSVAVAAAVAGAAAQWHRLTLDANDFWVSQTAPTGPADVRITDSLGHQVVLRQVRLVPGATVRSSVWMYRASPPSPAPGAPTAIPSPTRQAPAAAGGC